MRLTVTQLEWVKKFYNPTFIRFVIVGTLNTLISYLVYLFLLNVTTLNIAYSITYLLSVVTSYLLNLIYVFKEKHSFKKSLQFPLIYLLQFIFSVILLNFFVYFLGMNEKIAPLLIILLFVPITYFLMRIILTKS
ncbi:GtrA family protein [Legionella gresilensis]|uniref:GtrA family protein n=1 Tax=Legionella gresilensis TaxID=91823 RepID=UPI001A93E1EE